MHLEMDPTEVLRIKEQFLLKANWPAPKQIKTLITTRQGGISQAPWENFNLAQHVGDNCSDVDVNREIIRQQLPSAPIWLQQTHSSRIVYLSEQVVDSTSIIDADASFTNLTKKVCTVLTADCLPLLLTNSKAQWVAAIHAGWRGLADGIIQNSINTIITNMNSKAGDILVYLAPAIGPQSFEVGEEVFKLFMQQNNHFSPAFRPSKDKYFADIYVLARIILNNMGVNHIYGGEFCTYSDPQRFYSYRRDGQTGRMASLIWIDDSGK